MGYLIMKLELVDYSDTKENKPTLTQAPMPAYIGLERRAAPRRTHADRRVMVRFELDRQDRRQTKDRRAAKSVWDNRPLI